MARVLEISDAPAVEQRQHAVTSRPMMSKYDPWVNMLRTTVAAFAATVGGADAVTVQPFDRPLGRPDEFGRRIARNQMALFSEGPCRSGDRPRRWRLGGRAAHPRSRRRGLGVPPGPRDRHVPSATRWPRPWRRDDQVATRRRPLTGLTEYPNLAETLPERDGQPDDVRRYGAAFEAFRDEPAASRCSWPRGSVAAHTARASFAGNLLAAGGIAVEPAGPTKAADEVLAADAGQPVVCLVGPERGLRRMGCRPHRPASVRPGPATSSWPASPGGLDVDDSCAVGVDALAFLRRTHGRRWA